MPSMSLERRWRSFVNLWARSYFSGCSLQFCYTFLILFVLPLHPSAGSPSSHRPSCVAPYFLPLGSTTPYLWKPRPRPLSNYLMSPAVVLPCRSRSKKPKWLLPTLLLWFASVTCDRRTSSLECSLTLFTMQRRRGNACINCIPKLVDR